MVQGAAAVSFQGIQHKLRFAAGCCHEVHVIGPNVSSKQGPPAARTNLLQAPQYQFPARRIQDVGVLAHSISCLLFLAGVSLWQRGAICILGHRNMSTRRARKLSLLLTRSGAPIFMSRTLASHYLTRVKVG